MLLFRQRPFNASRSLVVGAVLLIASGALTQTSRGEYVTTEDTQLRSGPGENYAVVATIPQGIKINVVGREGYWLKVESKRGGKPGYIDEQYLAFYNRNSVRPFQFQRVLIESSVIPICAKDRACSSEA